MSDGGVNFHADVTSGNAPLTVHFTDETNIPQSNYTWNFGDGQSSAKDPPHTYNSPGTYDVSLTVYNGSGASVGTETKSGYIVVYAEKPSKPTADFNASPVTGPAPLSVHFTCLSSAGTLSYDWDFGDGTQHSAEMTAVHNYTVAGNYTVLLKVSNPGGSNIKSTTIVVTAPVAGNNTNNTSIAAGLIGTSVTAMPSVVSTAAAAAPQSGGLTFSISEDMLQIILTALIAIVIAFMVIYYFSSISKREESKHDKKAPAGRSMLKSRMPVIGQKAPDDAFKLPADAKHADAVKGPETSAKPADMPMMPVDAARQQEVVSAPEPIKAPVIISAPDVMKVIDSDIPLEDILGPEKPAKVLEAAKSPAMAKPPEAIQVPEPAKQPVKQTRIPAGPPAEKPAAVTPPEPKKQPPKLADLLKIKAKEENKTPPPAATPSKPSRRRNDVDKDYLYGLVMGENQEQDSKDKK